MQYITHFYMDFGWQQPVCGQSWEWSMTGFSFILLIMNTISQAPSPTDNIYEDIEKFAFFSKAALSSAPERRISAGYHPLP